MTYGTVERGLELSNDVVVSRVYSCYGSPLRGYERLGLSFVILGLTASLPMESWPLRPL